jgi:hypothetical protein
MPAPTKPSKEVIALQKAINLWYETRQKPPPVKANGLWSPKTKTIYDYFVKKGSVGIEGVRLKLRELVTKNLKPKKSASPDSVKNNTSGVKGRVKRQSADKWLRFKLEQARKK